MEKHSVEVTRIGYGGTLTIEVEAESKEKAVELALDEAGDHVFSEHSSEYVALNEEGEYPVYLFLGEYASGMIGNVSNCNSKEEIINALEEVYGDEREKCEQDLEEMESSVTVRYFHTSQEAVAFAEGIRLAMGYNDGAAYVSTSNLSDTEKTLIKSHLENK